MNEESSSIMQSQEQIHEQQTNQLNSNILADLAVKADIDDNKEVRDCLRAYKLNSQTKTLEASFKKFNKGVLIKTLIFLNVKNDISNYNRGKVVTELICRIQNLLLDECGMCGEQYATAMDEKLLLQCKLCGQNAHLKCLKTLLGEKFHDDLTSDCVSNLINPLKLDGLHYLCGSCSSSTIPSQDIGESHITKKLSTVNLDNEEQSGQHDKGLKNSPVMVITIIVYTRAWVIWPRMRKKINPGVTGTICAHCFYRQSVLMVLLGNSVRTSIPMCATGTVKMGTIISMVVAKATHAPSTTQTFAQIL